MANKKTFKSNKRSENKPDKPKKQVQRDTCSLRRQATRHFVTTALRAQDVDDINAGLPQRNRELSDIWHYD